MTLPRNKGRAPRPWPRYMTARVAADFSSTSPWTVRRNVRACGRRGRAFVYAIEDVERWMRGQPITAATISTSPAPRAAPSPSVISLDKIRALARDGWGPGALADDADSMAP